MRISLKAFENFYFSKVFQKTFLMSKNFLKKTWFFKNFNYNNNIKIK